LYLWFLKQKFITMQKFFLLPVTNEQNYLINCNNVLLVKQASTTTVTIAYGTGSTGTDILTITHAAAGAGVETMKDWVQTQIVEALKTMWQEVAYTPVTDAPFAVSGVAIA
jgi:hypothetical protein